MPVSTVAAATAVDIGDGLVWVNGAAASVLAVTADGALVVWEPAPSNTLTGTLTIQLDDIAFAANQFWGGMRFIPLAFIESTRGTAVESTRGTMRERFRGTMREGRRR